MIDKIVVPGRCMPSTAEEEESYFPCVMVYLGKAPLKHKKLEGESNLFHNLKRVDVGKTKQTQESVRELYNTYKQMTISELEQAFTIRSMSQFEPGTPMIYHFVKEVKFLKEGKETIAYVMRYEVKENGVIVNGDVYIPERTYNEAKKTEPGFIIYRGEKTSVKSGNTYYDILVGDISAKDILF